MRKKHPSQHERIIIVSVIGALVLLAGIAVAIFLICQNGAPATKNCEEFKRYGSIVEICAEDYIGLGYQEAMDDVRSKGLIPVTTVIEGETQIVTMYDIAFEIVDGKVQKAYFKPPR